MSKYAYVYVTLNVALSTHRSEPLAPAVAPHSSQKEKKKRKRSRRSARGTAAPNLTFDELRHADGQSVPKGGELWDRLVAHLVHGAGLGRKKEREENRKFPVSTGRREGMSDVACRPQGAKAAGTCTACRLLPFTTSPWRAAIAWR
jgi:hypothetical protein